MLEQIVEYFNAKKTSQFYENINEKENLFEKKKRRKSVIISLKKFLPEFFFQSFTTKWNSLKCYQTRVNISVECFIDKLRKSQAVIWVRKIFLDESTKKFRQHLRRFIVKLFFNCLFTFSFLWKLKSGFVWFIVYKKEAGRGRRYSNHNFVLLI